jgi:hypothetical protein
MHENQKTTIANRENILEPALYAKRQGSRSDIKGKGAGQAPRRQNQVPCVCRHVGCNVANPSRCFSARRAVANDYPGCDLSGGKKNRKKANKIHLLTPNRYK